MHIALRSSVVNQTSPFDRGIISAIYVCSKLPPLSVLVMGRNSSVRLSNLYTFLSYVFIHKYPCLSSTISLILLLFMVDWSPGLDLWTTNLLPSYRFKPSHVPSHIRPSLSSKIQETP